MKIKDIITENGHTGPIAVAHSPKEAETKFLQANKGKAGSEHDARAALKRVRNRYDVEIVGDLEDYMGHQGEKKSDKKDSMLTKDNR